MPEINVVIFAESNGSAPLLDWLDKLKAKAQDKCLVRVERLQEQGHSLRRPEADYLRDGIHELRVKHEGVNYRILYFFSGNQVVLSHGIQKEDIVPDREIDLAVIRREEYEKNPTKHTYGE